MLFAIFYEGISEASRLNLCKHGICIRLNRERPNLNTIELLRLGRRFGFRRFACHEQFLDFSTEGIHIFAMLREPVHDIAMVAGNPQLVKKVRAQRQR